MTNEEAIRILMWVFYKIRVISSENTYDTPPTEEEIKQAGNMAIEALQQEPCEDAISRQAVLDEISDYNNDLDYTTNELYDRIKRMPSVNPQPKTGHWVDIDEEPHEVWECDHCGFVIDGSGCIDPYDYRDTYKFCPNCGVKMVESRERSDKE